jgi:galactose mutarotase-like enzyme
VALDAFGQCELGPVQRLVLGSEPGVVLEVLDLGAVTHALWVTGGDGVRRNVLLGHATAQERLDSTHYLGASVGRYANRIRGGRFAIDGTSHQVGTADRGNSLHGGPDGFDRRIWEVVEATDDAATLRLVSPDGDQGFPGEVVAQVGYTVSGDSVRIELSATTDAPTPVNLTNHAYLDLAGEGSGTALDQLLQVPASTYLSVDDTAIPLDGPPSEVSGTPFDLREPTVLGDAARADHPQVRVVQGIDHCFLVEGAVEGEGLRLVATLESASTRTRLEMHSDQPGLQVYTGNMLDGTLRGTSGRLYRQGDGVALEAQLLPDTPNRPDFGDAVLRPGARYQSTIEWRLGVDSRA